MQHLFCKIRKFFALACPCAALRVILNRCCFRTASTFKAAFFAVIPYNRRVRGGMFSKVCMKSAAYINSQKLEFLYRHTLAYYLKNLPYKKEVMPDIPQFLLDKEREEIAIDLTIAQLKRIIFQKRIDECYENCKRFEKQRGFLWLKKTKK